MKVTYNMKKLTLSFNQVAQASHLFLGALIVCAGVAKFGHSFSVFLKSNVLAILFAAAKEFWYDARYEDSQTRGSDFEDFMFYLVGMVTINLYLLV